MSDSDQPRSSVPANGAWDDGPIRLSRGGLPIALAVIVPLTAAIVTGQVPYLRPLPFALAFVSVAMVATYTNLGPTLLACAVAIVAHIYFVDHRWLLTIPEVSGSGLILVLALFLNRIASRRRKVSRELQATLKALTENTGTLIEAQQASKCASWTFDLHDKTRWQPGGFEIFGIPFSQVEQLNSPIELILPEDQPGVRNAVRQMIDQHAALLVEYRVLFPNGEVHWSEARGNPDPDHPTRWRGVTFDITDRKHAEAALIRSEKLAAMGRLASTVAHEVNNPLEAVTNLLYLARTDEHLSPETQTYLATAEAELGRLSNITRLTLGFVRTSAGTRAVDLAGVLEDILAIFRHRCEMKAIQVERLYQPGVCTLIAPHELRQIVTNVLANAIDALTGPVCLLRLHIRREAGAAHAASSREMAVVLVEDSGVGIPRENFTRIFEPFFTTKEDIGTGIGLWVTRELLEKNQGGISVESGELADGMRTRFRIELPAIPVQPPVSVPVSVKDDAATASTAER